MTLATRIGVMTDGIIKQVGEPRDVYEAPVNRFVADFIGNVNLFEGRVDAAAPDAMRIMTQDAGPVIVPPQPGLTAGQTVWIALRPERITLTRAEPETANRLRVVVEEVGYRGNLSTYRIRLAGGRLVTLTQSNRLRDEDPITWDETVWASWQPLACRVLTE